MRKIIKYCIVGVLFVLSSCTKDNVLDVESKGKLSLDFKEINAENLKSAKVDYLKNVSHVVLSIEKDGAVYADFDSKKINLQKWANGQFSIESLRFDVGVDYQVTKFELQDSDNKILFATPLKGSKLAAFVSKPLAVSFDISIDKTTQLDVEVVSTHEASPKDFGFAEFNIKVVGQKYRLKRKEISIGKHLTMKDFFYKKNDILDYAIKSRLEKAIKIESSEMRSDFKYMYHRDGKVLVSEYYKDNTVKDLRIYKSNAIVKEIRGIKKSRTDNGNYYDFKKFIYNTEGLCIEKKRYNFFPAQLRSTTRYEYEGLKLVKTVKTVDGVKKTYTLVTFDEVSGKIKKELKYTYETNALISKVIYYYETYLEEK